MTLPSIKHIDLIALSGDAAAHVYNMHSMVAMQLYMGLFIRDDGETTQGHDVPCCVPNECGVMEGDAVVQCRLVIANRRPSGDDIYII